jgi:Ca2+-transporting ATPase
MNFTILKPAHLLWINLITDCFPAIGLGMEEAEANTMTQPPRKKTDGIFSGGLGVDVILQGTVIAVLTVVSYIVGHYLESGSWAVQTSPDGMTMAFLTLSLMEIFHSFNMRSRRASLFTLKKQNVTLWGTLVFSLVLTVTILYVPALRRIFSFSFIDGKEFGIAVGLAFLIIPIVEISKLIQRAVEKK